jgi:pimeloyl-ACP methyl ester carboxylesterase
MGAGSWSWMDVIGPLSAFGPVVAPDLPGSGRSRPSARGAGSAADGARALAGLVQRLDLAPVVVHGHSMGGLVGALFAAHAPEAVERLILTAAPLPGSPDPPDHPRLWDLGLDAARLPARILVGVGVRWKAAAWRRLLADQDGDRIAAVGARVGIDLSHLSPEMRSLLLEELEHYRLGWRVDGAVNAALSAVRALTVDEARTRAALDGVTAPTLLLWGANDRIIPSALVEDLTAARPDWTSRTIEGVGHLLPWEAPERYVEIVTTDPGHP